MQAINENFSAPTNDNRTVAGTWHSLPDINEFSVTYHISSPDDPAEMHYIPRNRIMYLRRGRFRIGRVEGDTVITEDMDEYDQLVQFVVLRKYNERTGEGLE